MLVMLKAGSSISDRHSLLLALICHREIRSSSGSSLELAKRTTKYWKVNFVCSGINWLLHVHADQSDRSKREWSRSDWSDCEATPLNLLSRCLNCIMRTFVSRKAEPALATVRSSIATRWCAGLCKMQRADKAYIESETIDLRTENQDKSAGSGRLRADRIRTRSSTPPLRALREKSIQTAGLKLMHLWRGQTDRQTHTHIHTCAVILQRATCKCWLQTWAIKTLMIRRIETWCVKGLPKWPYLKVISTYYCFSYQWGLSALRLGTQTPVEAILACYQAPVYKDVCTEWLGWVARSRELPVCHIRIGPSGYKQALHAKKKKKKKKTKKAPF